MGWLMSSVRLKPFESQSSSAQIHHSRVKGLAQICRARSSNTQQAVQHGMVFYHCAHIVHMLFTDSCLQSRLLVLAARHLNWLQQSEQNDGCIYRSSIKLTQCEWPFPGVHHLQLRSHLPQICAGAEWKCLPHTADGGHMFA